jgi:molybdopterin-containing oxidoreductase family iron-sulfur binding subunit
MSSLNEHRRFDADAARAALRSKRGPALWRSLEELADSEGFLIWLREQHASIAEALQLDRRGFLKYMGASLALAGLSGCGRPPRGQIVPYLRTPPGQVEGVPRFFATCLLRAGYAHGVLVQSRMGRPTKIEGNPHHPASLGATDVFGQADILQLWDPDRSQAISHRGDTAARSELDAALLAMTAGFDRDAGAGLRVLTGTVTSPTLSAQLDELLTKYQSARWHVHQPVDAANEFAGAQLAYGRPVSTRLHFERARVVVSLDADFVSDPAGGLRYAHDYAASRLKLDNTASRLYVIESAPSLTGSMADHRLPLRPDDMARLALQLAKRLGLAVDVSDDTDPERRRWLDALTTDLEANRATSLVVVGPSQEPWMHALGHVLNAALENVGSTLDYCEPVEKRSAAGCSLSDLVAAIDSGCVDTLLMIGCNPVYDAPVDLRVAEALKRVPHVLHLGLYRDESASLAEWHIPMAHVLESWSDARAYDGTASIVQPLIAPLYDGLSAHEVLAQLLGEEAMEPSVRVRRHWRGLLKDDEAWEAALRTGVIAHTTPPPLAAAVRPGFRLAPTLRTSSEDSLDLLFRSDPTIGDGTWANNGWLQELPKPLTQLTWDNAALVSPALAARLNLRNGDVVDLCVQDRALRAPIWVMPGQAPQSVTVHLGYGRRRAGRVGDGLGFDAYSLRTTIAPWHSAGLQLRKTGDRHALAATQHHFNVEGRDLVRSGTLQEYLQDPHFATASDRFAGPPPSLYPNHPAGEYTWGMSIDLNSCIGCSACTIACQAENNIPVVGKDQVSRGREMHWIRVDRYYEGSAERPRVYSQPVPCMMCEHAPCEVVCPVGATVHDSEGLNLQVYNRCVGTRFCSNNCPYKVRRFNFLQYVDESAESLKAQRNPEVTVRRRGVMEKCTYCIQRIESAHIDADRDDRRIRDGEVVTACQAVCPTRAIYFGNMADPQSMVARAKASGRSYVMLGELNTRPRTSYLARLRNPHPLLKDEP